MSYVSLQPLLLNKPRVAVDARPWHVFLNERDNERFLPPGGTMTLAALAQAVRAAYAGAPCSEDDDWLMRTLARDERRALLFTYVPDLTMSLPNSPFIPSRLDVNTRARVVALLLRRAFRPRDDETVDERWLQQRLDPQRSRWFATLSDVVGDPAHYHERWKARAFQLHVSSYGDRTNEQLQRDWNVIVDGAEGAEGANEAADAVVAPRERELLLYPARLFVVARWLQRLGFRHVMDWDAVVPAPDEARAQIVAPERELLLVGAPTHAHAADSTAAAAAAAAEAAAASDSEPKTNASQLTHAQRLQTNSSSHASQLTHAQRLQMSILWLHGIVPDDVSENDDKKHRHEAGDDDDGDDDDGDESKSNRNRPHWRLRHVSGWTAQQLRPRLARARA